MILNKSKLFALASLLLASPAFATPEQNVFYRPFRI